MATYQENYQLWLEEQMAAGGTPGFMQECVDEYNAAERFDALHPLFVRWYETTKHRCAYCQTEFKAPSGLTLRLAEARQEVTCEKCLPQTDARANQPGVERPLHPRTPEKNAP